MKPWLIAPCGINCGLCSGYLAFSHKLPRVKGKINHCRGCRPHEKQCAGVKMRCAALRLKEIDFCYECREFPCANLKRLDARYKERYGESPIENLRVLKAAGMKKFLASQRASHTCPRCRTDFICMHNARCYACDTITTWKREGR